MRRRHSGERGAVAIEAALIFPLLILLVFGIIEWSLVLKDQVELTSVARAGARTGSSLSPDRPFVPPSPTSPTLTRQVVDSLVSASSSLPPDTIDYVMVYKANKHGYPGPDSNSTDMSCVGAGTTCDTYVWDPTLNSGTGDFRNTAGTPWTGSDVNACQGEATMTNIGVYARATHKMITGLFGSEQKLTAYTVMRFEPRPPGACK